MKKILFIHDYPPLNGGGLAINVLDLASFLSKKYQCKIITSRLKDNFTDNSMHVKKPIIVYNSNRFYLLCILIKEILKSDILMINFTFSYRIFSILSLLINFVTKKKSILIVHTRFRHLNFNKFMNYPNFIKKFLILFLKLMSLSCNKVVVFSNDQRLLFNRVGFKNVIKLPMFINNIDEYTENFNFSINCKKKRNVYYIGELSRLKCFDRFVDEIESGTIPCPVVIVGNGELKEKIINRITENGEVEIYDTVNYEDIKKILRKAYSIYFPSINDSWGRIIIESMLSGVLVIAPEIPLFEDMNKESYININRFKNLDEIMNHISSAINIGSRIKIARLEALRCNEAYKNNWIKIINSFYNNI